MKSIIAALILLVSQVSFGTTNVERNKETTRKFLMLVGTPEAIEIVKAGTMPGTLAPDIFGRVNPIGALDTDEGTIEYFFGPGGGQGVPNIRVEPVEIPVLIGENELTFAQFIVTWTDTKDASKTKKLFFDSVFRFNSDGLIVSYDLNACDIGLALDSSLTSVDKGFLKAGLCMQITNSCTGDNKVYDDFSDCMKFFDTIPLGSFNQGNSNTMSCRSIHLGLTTFRPEIHCAHVGKEGGGKCVDKPYLDRFQFNLFEAPVSSHNHK